MSGMILIDLQKAFDMIDHDIFLKKLRAIGFSNHTIDWFRSYRSRHPEVFPGNCVLKICSKFTGEHPC